MFPWNTKLFFLIFDQIVCQTNRFVVIIYVVRDFALALTYNFFPIEFFLILQPYDLFFRQYGFDNDTMTDWCVFWGFGGGGVVVYC